jgi:hypothetical protein
MAIRFPWQVKGSLITEKTFSEYRLPSSRRFSTSVQKSLRCGRSLDLNNSSWNLHGRKYVSYVVPSTLSCARHHLIPCLPALSEKRLTNALHSLVTWLSARIILRTKATCFSKRLVPLVNGLSVGCFYTIILTKPSLNQCFCSDCNTHFAFSTSVKYII